MKLENRVAIVTGGANGIGRAIALRLAQEGANLVIADIDVECGKDVSNEIKALGQKALSLKVDVTRSRETDRMAKATLDKFGRIDILVNDAGGVIREGLAFGTNFHELPEKICDAVIDLNVKGVLNCCRSVIPHMVRQCSGKIVNIGSVAGVIGSHGTTDYSLSKGAVIAFTRAVSKELAPYNINVNCVSPGAIDHPGSPKNREAFKRQKLTIFSPRFGLPEDVANAVAFLASDEASYIVGQNVLVCGGRSLGGVTDTEW